MWFRSYGVWVGIFGDKFREERERRGFTLDDISNVTKISSRMLQAIEQEHFNVLPGGVFNKGFVRAYAKVLGFNAEESITGYLGALRQAQLDAQNLAWDQPLPQRTTAGSIKQALPKGPVAEASRVVEKAAPPASLKWTTIKPVSGPAISQPSASISSPAAESTQPNPTLRVSGKPESLTPQLPVEPKVIQPPVVQPSTIQAPPLWISPSPVSTPTISSSSSQAPSPSEAVPLFARKETPHAPVAPMQQESSVRILIDEPAAKPSVPGKALPERQNKYASAAKVLPPRGTASSWKIPALILALGAIVIVALLANRNPRHVTIKNPEPAQANSASAPEISSGANSVKQDLSRAPAPAAIAHAPAEPAKIGTNASAENTSSLTAAATPVSNRKPVARPATPAPFRVGINAVENCSISITADGELVARENLIAPANTSVKASHEIIVQVSNPAAINFRWNDRSVGPQGAEARGGSKTFVFDNKGLRSGQ